MSPAQCTEPFERLEILQKRPTNVHMGKTYLEASLK